MTEEKQVPDDKPEFQERNTSISDFSNEQINEIKLPAEFSARVIMIRILDFRVQRLTKPAERKLQSALNEIAHRVVAEAFRIADSENKKDHHPTISDGDIASGFSVEYSRRFREAREGLSLRSLSLNLFYVGCGSSLPFLLERKWGAACACLGFTIICLLSYSFGRKE